MDSIGSNEDSKKKDPLKKMRRFFYLLSRITLVMGGLFFLLPLFIGLWAFAVPPIFIAIGLLSEAVKIVGPTERLAITNLGKFARFIGPGLHLTIPFIGQVAAKAQPINRGIPLFLPDKDGKNPTLQMKDEEAELVGSILRFKMKDNAEEMKDLLFRIRKWSGWLRDLFGPIVSGYLQTLLTAEALDAGMARGDLFERIKGAEARARATNTALTKKIKEVREKLVALRGLDGADSESSGISNIYENLLEQLEYKKAQRAGLPKLYKEMAGELEDAIEEAHQFEPEHFLAIVKDINLPKAMKEARRLPTMAQKEAEAAFHQAQKEGILRAGPVRKVQAELQEAGMKSKEALSKALELDVIDTISKAGGAGAIPIASAIESVMPLILGLFLKKGKTDSGD